MQKQNGLAQQRPGRRGRKALMAIAVTILLLTTLSVAVFAGRSSIGDFVWHDTDADGITDSGELGINGVVVELWEDTDDSGDFDPTLDTRVATSTTIPFAGSGNIDDNGYYDFNVIGGTTTNPSKYLVVITDTNFLPGGALDGYVYTGNLPNPPEAYSGPEPRYVALSEVVADYNDADFAYAKAQVELVKTAGNAVDGDIEYLPGPAGATTYHYTLTNTGEVAIDLNSAGYGITDDKCSPLAGPTSGDVNNNGYLDVGETWTYTCDATGLTGTITNTAIVTGNPVHVPPVGPAVDLPGNDVVVTDTAVVDVVNPAIVITKTVYGGHDNGVSCPGVDVYAGATGDAVTYCFVVKNTGDTVLSAQVDDNDVSAHFGPDTLQPDETKTYFLETTINGALVNTATATGTSVDENGTPLPDIDPVTDTDTAQVTVSPTATPTLPPTATPTLPPTATPTLPPTATPTPPPTATPTLPPTATPTLPPTATPASTFTLGDTVWYDQDKDGIQDAGEPGVPNVTATLYQGATCTAGNEMGSPQTTTGAGFYEFTGLSAGTYSVGFTDIPAGWSISSADQGGDEAKDSDANASGCIQNISLSANDPDEDMGLYATGSIGDRVWCDADSGMDYDTGEGVNGVQVTLYEDTNCDGNADGAAIASMDTMDGNGDAGYYQFTGLDVALAGSGQSICYVTVVDATDDDLGTCKQPITPTSYSPDLNTNQPNRDDNDFGFQKLRVLITESYAVTDVDEDGTPNPIACYWLRLESQPSGPVIIDIAPDAQVATSKSSVTLDPSNWNSLSLDNRTNMVCISAVDDQVADADGQYCSDKSDSLFGQPVAGNQRCGDHMGFVSHTISAVSAAPYDRPGIPFYNTNGPDFDNDQSTIDALVRNDDGSNGGGNGGGGETQVRVLITESYAITDVDEDGTPNPIACYWLRLESQPQQPVTINIFPDGQVATNKSSVVLDVNNWNSLTLANRSNKVCVSAVDDQIADATGQYCDDMSDSLFGQPVAGNQRCGDQKGSINHTISTSDPQYGKPGVGFYNTNGPDTDENQATIDALVRDDDSATVQINPATLNLVEGQSGDVEVVLGSQPAADVTVTNGSESLIFTPATWSQPQTLTVSVPDNADPNGDQEETMLLRASSADPAYNQGEAASLRILVADNDLAGMHASASMIALTEGGASASYDLALTARPSAPVSVAIDGQGQVTADPGQVIFTPENWNLPQTVTVTAVDDARVEADQSIIHLLHQIASADGAYQALPAGELEVRIVDNDVAGVVFAAIDGLQVSEDGASASYDIVLSSEPSASVMVAVNADAQVQVSPATLAFDADNWNQPQRVTVTAVDDAVDEGENALGLISHSVNSADASYDGMALDGVQVTAVDNDVAGVRLSTTSLALAEGGAADSYEVSLTSQPQAPVYVMIDDSAQVTVSAECGLDGDMADACLIFDASNWSQPQTVTVIATDDARFESSADSNIIDYIRHHVSSTDARYSGLTVADVAVSIRDNDRPVYLPLVSKR